VLKSADEDDDDDDDEDEEDDGPFEEYILTDPLATGPALPDEPGVLPALLFESIIG
jgi:hypothetical protein